VEIRIFQSKKKISPFAPEWNYIIAESKIENINFNKVKEFLLKKENEILSLPTETFKNPNNKEIIKDGYTGLGNSTTSRFTSYNVLRFENKEIKKIKDNINNAHNVLLKSLNFKKPDKLFIQCWYNVMKKGQSIKPHVHDGSNLSYLSGHICVTTNDTYTGYITSFHQMNYPEVYKITTEQNKLTLFQSCVPHFTSSVNNNDYRITIAFDLFLEKKNNNCEELY
jgi:hypothetical protein